MPIEPIWAAGYGGADTDGILDVETDTAGNIFVAMYFEGTVVRDSRYRREATSERCSAVLFFRSGQWPAEHVANVLLPVLHQGVQLFIETRLWRASVLPVLLAAAASSCTCCLPLLLSWPEKRMACLAFAVPLLCCPFGSIGPNLARRRPAKLVSRTNFA
jgi:hypothetical protein